MKHAQIFTFFYTDIFWKFCISEINFLLLGEQAEREGASERHLWQPRQGRRWRVDHERVCGRIPRHDGRLLKSTCHWWQQGCMGSQIEIPLEILNDHWMTRWTRLIIRVQLAVNFVPDRTTFVSVARVTDIDKNCIRNLATEGFIYMTRSCKVTKYITLFDQQLSPHYQPWH